MAVQAFGEERETSLRCNGKEKRGWPQLWACVICWWERGTCRAGDRCLSAEYEKMSSADSAGEATKVGKI